MKNLYLSAFLLVAIGGYSQTTEEIKQITANYDKQALNDLSREFREKYERKYNYAREMAAIKGWPLEIRGEDGSYQLLVDVNENGDPVYSGTQNMIAAISTRANYLHTGGGLGLALNGEAMTAGVWDGGKVMETHPELTGRVLNMPMTSGTLYDGHATHVTGTIIATGINTAAKGMAPMAAAKIYGLYNDIANATSEASNGLLISNHSYHRGDDTNFGRYTDVSRDWDNLHYNAPYYLMVCSSGNENGAKPRGFAVSKNTMTVFWGHPATIDSNGNFVSADVSVYSSKGPTNDLRIKPDIVGDGQNLYSTYGNSSYDVMSGSSMASPNVAGTLLLLQQYSRNLNNSFMKAATLKGLALHTADDITGSYPVGPDRLSGWGYLNGKKAAETMRDNQVKSVIHETTLNNNQSHSFEVISDDISTLMVSISWTDPEGVEQSLQSSTTPVLVNDLDVRITQNNITYFPYALASASSTVKTDNFRDPFERIDIPNASGIYTVTISHKGVLTDNAQDYSLVITGITHCSQIPEFVTAPAVAPGNISNKYATNTITASTTVAANAVADYKAGGSIILQPGFVAETASDFLAEIWTCSSDLPQQSLLNKNKKNREKAQQESKPLAIDQKMSLYPNPASESVTIELTDGLLTEISIYSIDGKHVITQLANTVSHQINTSALQKGIYLLNVKTDSGQILTDKLIIK